MGHWLTQVESTRSHDNIDLLYVVFENESLQRYCLINIALCLCGTYACTQGRQTGGVGGSQPPLNFGWGVEHLSTPPDFEKKIFRGGLAPLKLI